MNVNYALAARLIETEGRFSADDPNVLGRFLSDSMAEDDFGWRSENAADIDLGEVDWPVVASLVSE